MSSQWVSPLLSLILERSNKWGDMSLAEGKGAGPFYFKSFDSVVGVAQNAEDLRREIARLADENPGALEYHLKERHIVLWLESLNEKGLADELMRVDTIEDARAWASRSHGNQVPSSQKSRPSGSAPRTKRGRKKR